MPNIVLRILSVLVLVPLVIGLYWLGGAAWLLFLAVVTGLLSFEWLKLIGNPSPKANAFLIGVFFTVFLLFSSIPFYAVVFLGLPAAVGQNKNRALAALTGPYIAFPMVCILLVGVYSTTALLWLAAIVWLTDTFGLIFGKLIGGPKLAPTLSPQKTWAGLVGGVFGALAVTGLFMAFTATATPSLYAWAAVLSLVSQAGDLFESKFKRKFHVKDSGALIPGHGGVLDRMDSFLFAAPAMWALLAYGLIKL